MPVLLHGLTKKVDPRRLSPSLLAVADLIEPELAEIFIAVVTDTRTRINLEDLAEAIIAGDLESTEVAAQLGFLESSLNEKLPEPLRRAFLRAADAVADVLEEDFNIAVRFDVSNPNAVEYARDQVGVNVREIARETVQAIRDIIGRSVGAEIGQAEPVVREIRDVIGLRTDQIDQVTRYRDDLMAGGADRLDAELKAMKEAHRLLGERALLVARTEVMDALSAGAFASWGQAIEKGLVNPTEVTVEWIATPDEKTCPICSELDGERVNFGQPWKSAELGEYLERPPAHPACRCSAALVPKTVEELQAEDAGRQPRAASHRPVTRGYPEFDPDQPRDETGQWTGGGALDDGEADTDFHDLKARIEYGLQDIEPLQAEAYREAVHMALSKMSPRFRSSVAISVQRIVFHGDVDAVTDAWRESAGTVRASDSVLAYWAPANGELHLDGEFDRQGRSHLPGGEDLWHVYAHEFAHALDYLGPMDGGGQTYSTTQEWQGIWTDEIYTHGVGDPPLSAYARTSMSEGFAEYARLVLSDRTSAEQKFPKAWGYWKLHGLV